MNNDYIPIKEFANKVGVSTQAIYQRLEKDLQSYLKVEDGKKTLNIKALELFNTRPVANDNLQGIDNELYKTLQDTLNMLQEQIRIKDEQLKNKDYLIEQQRSDYNKQLQAKDLQIERLNKSNENNQILIAQTQERVKQLEAPKEEPLKEKRSFLDIFFKG